MPQERKRQRQFDVAPGERVKFSTLPGMTPLAASGGRTAQQIANGRDIWWLEGPRGYVSEILTTEDILEALREPAPPPPRPDHLELRQGMSGWFEVTVIGDDRVLQIEQTEHGLRALVTLAQGRKRLPPAPLGPKSWVPSEWEKVDPQVLGCGKYHRLTETGRARAVEMGVECEL